MRRFRVLLVNLLFPGDDCRFLCSNYWTFFFFFCLLSFSSTVILYPLTWVWLWLLLIGLPPDMAMPGCMMRNRCSVSVSSRLGTAWDDSRRWRHGNSGESNDLVLR
ncbi:uncharacterized protein FOBCDRAFT_35503 [Fusarium oxysporum Fo47]|uniref:uncharacterized protein n=1 Tax=Fusarium oxysporum Fo47 TaxID=660027 RepID=UPI002869BBBD|nr:uncharacterized protein FOBCDRAFT_35503 [Fusarium oxysporum Fo47]WJG35333.1 hypothetical protein FOBCDRAFT_35503 [Fusarium oxysporum Fo47]